MAKFAVIENGLVINTILAESKKIAEEITEKTCIEYTTEIIGPGATWNGSQFIPAQPFPSWILDESNQWKPPVPRPEDTDTIWYTWNEDVVNWKGFPANNNN